MGGWSVVAESWYRWAMALTNEDLSKIQALVEKAVDSAVRASEARAQDFVLREIRAHVDPLRDELTGFRQRIEQRFDGLELLLAKHDREVDSLTDRVDTLEASAAA